MFRSVRWPLALSYFALLLVSLTAMAYYLLNAVREHYLASARIGLIHQATVIADQMGNHMDQATLTEQTRKLLATQMIRLSRGVPGRMCIVNWQGKVLEDSEKGGLQNLLDHPEVREALNGRLGVSLRGLGPSPLDWRDAADPTMHVAVPLEAHGKTVGAVYASRSLLDVQGLLLALEEQIWRIAFVGVVAAGFVGLILARLLTGPLTRLTRAARRLADGHLEERISVRGRNELAVLGGAFNDMAESLQRQQDTLLQFVSDASHELKTPLASMKALTEVLEDGALEEPETAKRLTRHLRKETDRMDGLVRDLLHLHRLETGALTLDPVPTDPVELAEAAATPYQAEVVDRLKPGTTLHADPDRLRQVLANLLDNAARAVRESQKPEIRIVLEPEGGKTRISVEDNGVGLATADLERVFSRFYRVDTGRARQEGGSGLGLSICRRIVEAHGGRIWAERRPEGGAAFRFIL